MAVNRDISSGLFIQYIHVLVKIISVFNFLIMVRSEISVCISV